jgi:hypothetical protein
MKITPILILSILLIAFTPSSARAQVLNQESPYFQIDEDISISNEIIGEAYIIGNSITINSPIDGDLFAIADKVTVNAPINGDLRVIASKSLDIRSNISGSVSFVTPNVYISPIGEVDQDVWGITQKINVEGRIGRDLNLRLAPNADIRIDGKILGDFFYSDSRPNITSKAVVEGKSEKITLNTNSGQAERISSVVSRLFHSLSLILIGLLALRLKPEWIREGYYIFKLKFSRNIIRGFITLLLAPPLVVLLVFSLFGIPLALFIVALLSFVIYISPLLPSIWIGDKIFNRNEISWIQITIGILIFDIITMIPIMSTALYALSIISFTGLVSRYIKS